MSNEQVMQAIDRVLVLSQNHDPNADESAITGYRFAVLPPISWDKRAVETTFQITIPPNLETLWNSVSALHLFQLASSPNPTGLMILSPHDLAIAQEEAKTVAFPDDLRRSDLIIGVHRVLYDFRVVVRCDLSDDDFGFVFVTQEIEQRQDWVYAAESVGEFLLRYLDAVGKEYWHTGEEPHVRS